MDRQAFLDCLDRSGLLTAQQIALASSRLTDQDGVALARSLVEEGLLTRYQVEQLLAGRARGFWLGPYRILDRLGRGGMGTVYKAVHTVMGRIVALKVIRLSVIKNQQELLQFEREIRVLAQMQHPNIVMAYDADTVRGVRYLAMEYVVGKSIGQWVAERGPMRVPLAIELLRQSATALQYAHDRGLVHRDLKPSNLFITRQRGSRSSATPSGLSSGGEYVLKVLDFGLAHLSQGLVSAAVEQFLRQQGTGAIFGTADYMSPEQGRDFHAVDIRSDLYSLGCSFYFALAGQVPFAGNTAMEKLVKHLEEPATPLRNVRPEVPAELEAIVLRLMAKDPGERFQSPTELLSALEPLCRPEVRGPLSGDTLIGQDSRTSPGAEEEVGVGFKLPSPGGSADSLPDFPPPLTDSASHSAYPSGRSDRWRYLGVGVALGMVLTLAALALARLLT